MDGGGESAEGLVGTDVGSGFLAADVLLASGEREHEAALAGSVDSLTGEAAGHLANEFVARCDNASEWAAITGRQTETLRFQGDDVGFGGGLDRAKGNTFDDGNDEQGAGCVSRVGDAVKRFENA